MNNSKQLQKINSNILDKIQEVYVSNIEEIKQYYPQHIKKQMENLDDKAKIAIIKTGRRMTSGIKSSIPMKCKVNNCCLASICALLDNNIAPSGYPCPYEELMVDKLTAEYYMSLEIDPFNRTERDQVKQMVELIIIDNRASANIADEGLYSEQVIGIDNKGRVIKNKVESLAYNIKMKTQSRLDKLQNELLATRKIRKQLQVGKKDDPASKASDLFERYKELTEAKVKIINESKESTNK